MFLFGINTKKDNDTFTMKADHFEIRDGFLRLYQHGFEYAAYSVDDINHIVAQPYLMFDEDTTAGD